MKVVAYVAGQAQGGFSVMPSRFPGACKCGCRPMRKIGKGQLIAYGVVGDAKVTVRWPQCPEARSGPPAPGTTAEVIPNPSQYQTAIRTAATTTDNHLIVCARAGCGKSTTALWVLAAILAAAAAVGRIIGRVVFLAFNKDVADSLADKVPADSTARTTHSFGKSAIDRAFPRAKMHVQKVYEVIDQLIPEVENSPTEYRRPVRDLVKAAKNAALLPSQRDAIADLIDNPAAPLDISDDIDRDTLVDYVVKVLTLGLPKGGVLKSYDFEDMLYIPAVCNIHIDGCGFVAVDESQDFCPSQLILIEKLINAGARVMMVGDEFQSLYAFRGADSKAFERLARLLELTDRKATRLMLPVNYRSTKAIIRHAQEIVPDIQFHPDAPEGVEPDNIGKAEFLANVKPGDAVLCRVNSGLVECAVHLLRAFKPVRVAGREEIGMRLMRLVDELGAEGKGRGRTVNNLPVVALLTKLSEYEDAQTAKMQNNPKMKWRLESIRQNCECIRFLATAPNTTTAADIKRLINTLFPDDDTPNSKVITLSTIHRAKGLEWDIVYVICPEKLPHPLAETDEQKQQEWNALYVVRTRPRKELHYVDGFGKRGGCELVA